MADVEFRTYLPYHKNSVGDLVVVTDDEPTWTQINQLVISDSLPAGEYLVSLHFDFSMPDTNDHAWFRVISPITLGTTYKYQPGSADQRIYQTWGAPRTYAGGPITFTFEASKDINANDLTIYSSAIEFERKA